jgi:hypothetical protein
VQVVDFPEEIRAMSAVGYACCSVCGKKLHATFFCQGCGQPTCSLDCYCRHRAGHARPQDRPSAEPPAIRLMPAWSSRPINLARSPT